MPTHAQQVRRRLDALGAEVTDTSPRGGLNLTALLPAGVAWNRTGNHEVRADYEIGHRDAGFTALLGIIKQGTFECDTAGCERCGRAPATPITPLELITVAISGKAMSTIEGSDLYQSPAKYVSSHDDRFWPAQRAGAALKAAPRRQRGKGYQYAVTADPAALAVIADYCHTVGEAFAGDGTAEPETRAEGQALLTAAERLRDAVRAAAQVAA